MNTGVDWDVTDKQEIISGTNKRVYEIWIRNRNKIAALRFLFTRNNKLIYISARIAQISRLCQISRNLIASLKLKAL